MCTWAFIILVGFNTYCFNFFYELGAFWVRSRDRWTHLSLCLYATTRGVQRESRRGGEKTLRPTPHSAIQSCCSLTWPRQRGRDRKRKGQRQGEESEETEKCDEEIYLYRSLLSSSCHDCYYFLCCTSSLCYNRRCKETERRGTTSTSQTTIR